MSKFTTRSISVRTNTYAQYRDPQAVYQHRIVIEENNKHMAYLLPDEVDLRELLQEIYRKIVDSAAPTMSPFIAIVDPLVQIIAEQHLTLIYTQIGSNPNRYAQIDLTEGLHLVFSVSYPAKMSNGSYLAIGFVPSYDNCYAELVTEIKELIAKYGYR